ncbi:MAG: RnfH family protein, partial [Gammaproteobacteria bacterium]|nr:RnfH family protein [Gammaproteobacteria bacterium]
MTVTVTVVCSPRPREVFEQAVELPTGATVRDAVSASRLSAEFPSFDGAGMQVGIWGRAAHWEQIGKHTSE